MRKTLALVLLLTVACASDSGPDGIEPAQVSPSVTPTDPPASGGPLLRFAVLGDWGAGTEEQFRLADRMCSWRERHPFDLVLTTGDNIYDEGHPDFFRDRFFRPYSCLLRNDLRFRAVLGNHDIGTDNGRPELREPRFGMRARNYVIRKNGVRFVMWDSNTADRGWLRRNLGEGRGDRWTVVSFHHPVFTPGPHGNTAGFAPSLPRLFRKKSVDLVVNGHDHLYALMPEKRRIRYVVTGGGGARLYGCENPEATEVCIARHHFLYVVAGEKRLVVRAVPISGRPFHNFATEGRG